MQMNYTQEKHCILNKLFDKLDVRRKSIVTLAPSSDCRKIFCKSGFWCVNWMETDCISINPFNSMQTPTVWKWNYSHCQHGYGQKLL